MMMDLQEVRERLQSLSPSKVARETGLHLHTVRRVRNGERKTPSVETVKILSDYLQRYVVECNE